MKIAVSSYLLLLGLVNAQEHIYHQQFAADQFGLRLHHGDDQATEPDYAYSYDVRDDSTGDRKRQEESRSGDQVRGSYSLLDADGSTRTVEYSVNSQSGFNAVVRRDGDQISVPNPSSRAIPLNFNAHQRRRPLASEIFRNRYHNERTMRLDTRTRLAQDARTGNVVDLHSGFGVAPHFGERVLPTHTESRTQGVNRNNLNELHPEQIRTNAYENQRNENVQDILARSHYHTSPLRDHHSTAPIHFPGAHLAFGSRANLAYNRYSIRPVIHVDERRPAPIFADPNNENRASGRYYDINTQNFGEGSNENYPDINTMNPNIQYPSQQEEIRGPTTPVSIHPFHPTFGPQETYLESNDSRVAYHGQPAYYGARINLNDRSNIQRQQIETVSVHDDSVITDAIVTPAPLVSTVYPEAYATPAPEQMYHEIQRIPSSHGNVEVTANNAQNYLYPASTLPLNDNTPDHFFTGDNLAVNGISTYDFDVRNSHYNHLAAPVPLAETINHDIHLTN